MEDDLLVQNNLVVFPAFQNPCPSGVLMQQRNFPPTRKSISQKGAVKPFGPHYCIMYFRFVHASQTNARGAAAAHLCGRSFIS
jgi:hypothetical protein